MKISWFKDIAAIILTKYTNVERLYKDTYHNHPGYSYRITCNERALKRDGVCCRIDDWGDVVVDSNQWLSEVKRSLRDLSVILPESELESSQISVHPLSKKLFTIFISVEDSRRLFCESFWDYVKYKFNKVFFKNKKQIQNEKTNSI